MASKVLLNLAVSNLIKETTKSLNEEERKNIEAQVDSSLAKSLGSDWSNLPVSGPRMMVVVLVLNAILLPFGIVPSLLADQAIKKGKEMELEDKFSNLLESVREKKDEAIESEKFKELSEYASTAGKSVGSTLANLAQTGKKGATSLFDKGKGLFGFGRKKKSD